MKPIVTALLLLLTVNLHAQQGTITNLYDAFSKDTSLTKDFGFSCLVKFAGKHILFDAGSNADVFKHNAEKLKIDLTRIDAVVVSHAHFDHLNGIDYLLEKNPKVKIYFPYDIFWGAPVPFDATGQEPTIADSLPQHMRYFDGTKTKFTIMQSGRFNHANIEFIKESKEIFPGINIIATNSPFMGYFSCYPNKSFVEGQFQDAASDCKNTNLPELSLSMKTANGEVLIAGCSHTGIEHIVEQTQKVTGNSIELVYGGFHMIPFNREQTNKICAYMKNTLGVRKVAPAHCTGHLAFKILQDLYKQNYFYAGLGETISF